MTRTKTPTIIECPRGMAWFTVAAPDVKKRFSVKLVGADDAAAQKLPPRTAPAFFNPGDISSYWATAASTTTLLVRRDILCLYHPVAWKDEETDSPTAH